MSVSIPSHKNWTDFKKTHGIATGAVKGIDMGKAIDTYHNGLSHDFRKNAANAKTLETVFAKYLKTIDEKKVTGKFATFKADFTSDYLLMANRAAEEFDAMAGDVEAFGGRVGLLLKAAAKMKDGADLATLQAFRSGPVRGMMAAATQVKGYDPKKLVEFWTPVDEVINKLGTTTQQPVLDKVSKRVREIAVDSKGLAEKDGLTL